MSSALKIVLFTDQVASTFQTTRRTPGEVRQVSRDLNDLTFEAAERHRGVILKDTGDGHLIEFRSCADAVRCGAVIQERVRQRNESLSDERLRFELHVGIDAGELEVLESGDVRGTAANRAARVCSACPAGDVYFTQGVKDQLHEREAETASVGTVILKGLKGKTRLYRLVRWLGEREPVRNPFVWRSGITETASFFDRKRELRAVREFVRKQQNCQIVGPRRIGKTSLLRHVERVAPEWNDATAIGYMNSQLPQCFTLSGWLRRVSQQLGWPAPASDLGEFAESIEAMLANGRRPVLCLDEFEEVVQRRGEFTRDFFLTLRSVGERGLSIITASREPLSELTDPSDVAVSPFYNTFPLVRLDPFSEAEASEFVSLYRPGVPPFTAEERTMILTFAKGQPLALQVACFHFLEARENGQSAAAALYGAEEEMKALLPTW
jgi:uncharacterized protein